LFCGYTDVVKTRMQKQVIHPGKEPKVRSSPQQLDVFHCRVIPHLH
jgi:hypothetical protein